MMHNGEETINTEPKPEEPCLIETEPLSLGDSESCDTFIKNVLDKEDSIDVHYETTTNEQSKHDEMEDLNQPEPIHNQAMKNEEESFDLQRKTHDTVDIPSTHTLLLKDTKDKITKKQFICSVCLKSFALKHSLQKHIPIHTSENNYSCNVCLKSFARKSYLQRHILIHTSEKKYYCNVCSKMFAQTIDLQRHTLIHTGEKNYSCDVCLKSFTRKNTLQTHILIHTGEKKYSCNVCLKLFARKNNLRRHFLIHTGEKNYSCNVCLKSFTRKHNFQTHMLIHTG